MSTSRDGWKKGDFVAVVYRCFGGGVFQVDGTEDLIGNRRAFANSFPYVGNGCDTLRDEIFFGTAEAFAETGEVTDVNGHGDSDRL
jgi:hypothetical protein